MRIPMGFSSVTCALALAHLPPFRRAGRTLLTVVAGWLGVPIFDGSRVMGALVVRSYRTTNPFSARETLACRRETLESAMTMSL